MSLCHQPPFFLWSHCWPLPKAVKNDTAWEGRGKPYLLLIYWAVLVPGQQRDIKAGKRLLSPSTDWTGGGRESLVTLSCSVFPSPVTFSLRVLCGILAEALRLFCSMTLPWRADRKTLPWPTLTPQDVVSGDMTGDASPTKTFRYQQTLVSTIPTGGQNISYILALSSPLKWLNAFFAYKYPSLFVLRRICESLAWARAPVVSSSRREWGRILLFSVWKWESFLIPMGEKFTSLNSPDEEKNAGETQGWVCRDASSAELCRNATAGCEWVSCIQTTTDNALKLFLSLCCSSQKTWLGFCHAGYLGVLWEHIGCCSMASFGHISAGSCTAFDAGCCTTFWFKYFKRLLPTRRTKIYCISWVTLLWTSWDSSLYCI